MLGLYPGPLKLPNKGPMNPLLLSLGCMCYLSTLKSPLSAQTILNPPISLTSPLSRGAPTCLKQTY